MLLKILLKQPLKLLFLVLSLTLISACSQSDTPVHQYEHAVEGAFAAEISQNGNYSITSSIHHGLSLWDNRNNKLLYQWNHRNSENNDIYIVRISANNSFALSASRSEFAI